MSQGSKAGRFRPARWPPAASGRAQPVDLPTLPIWPSSCPGHQARATRAAARERRGEAHGSRAARTRQQEPTDLPAMAKRTKACPPLRRSGAYSSQRSGRKEVLKNRAIGEAKDHRSRSSKENEDDACGITDGDWDRAVDDRGTPHRGIGICRAKVHFEDAEGAVSLRSTVDAAPASIRDNRADSVDCRRNSHLQRRRHGNRHRDLPPRGRHRVGE